MSSPTPPPRTPQAPPAWPAVPGGQTPPVRPAGPPLPFVPAQRSGPPPHAVPVQPAGAPRPFPAGAPAPGAPFAPGASFAAGAPRPFAPAQPPPFGPAGPQPFPFIPVQQTAPPAGLEGPNPWTPPRPRPGRTALLVVGGMVTFLALLVVGGVLLAALAGGSATTPPASAPTTAPTQVQAIGEWYRGGGRQILGALADDFQNAGNATTAETLRAACTGLRSHVAAAQLYAPIPDAEAHQHFAAALERYQNGASDCLAGLSGASPQLINKAGEELAAGTRSLSESTQRIASLAGGRPI